MRTLTDIDECRGDLESTAKALGVAPDQLVGGLNLVEAAKVLGVVPSTLRHRALQGLIGCQRDGRRWIFTWQDLDEYIKKRRRPANPSGNGRVFLRFPGTDKIAAHAAHDPDVEAQAKEMGLL